jgi:hypothetical protein
MNMSLPRFALLSGSHRPVIGIAFRGQTERRRAVLPALEALEDRTALSSLAHGPDLLSGPGSGSNSSALQRPQVLGNFSVSDNGGGHGRSVGNGGPGYPLPPATGPALSGASLALNPPAAVFLLGGTSGTVANAFPLDLVPTLLTAGSAGPTSAPAALSLPAGLSGFPANLNSPPPSSPPAATTIVPRLGELQGNSNFPPAVNPGSWIDNGLEVSPNGPAQNALAARETTSAVQVQGLSLNALADPDPLAAWYGGERLQTRNGSIQSLLVVRTAGDTSNLLSFWMLVKPFCVTPPVCGTPTPVSNPTAAVAKLAPVAGDGAGTARAAVGRKDPEDFQERVSGEADFSWTQRASGLHLPYQVVVGLFAGYLFTANRVSADEKHRRPPLSA